MYISTVITDSPEKLKYSLNVFKILIKCEHLNKTTLYLNNNKLYTENTKDPALPFIRSGASQDSLKVKWFPLAGNHANKFNGLQSWGNSSFCCLFKL